MYNDVLPVVAPAVAAGAVTQLPNTGSNIWVTVAVAVAAGLLAWAVLNAKKRAQKQ